MFRRRASSSRSLSSRKLTADTAQPQLQADSDWELGVTAPPSVPALNVAGSKTGSSSALLSFRSLRPGSSKSLLSGGQPTSPRARTAAVALTQRAGTGTGSQTREAATVPQLMSENARLQKQCAELRERLESGESPSSSAQEAPAATSSTQAATTAPDLHRSAERGDIEAVKAALAARPGEKDAKNRFGRTALMEAARKGHLAVVDALLAAGADRTVQNKMGQSAAEFALEQDHHFVYARLHPDGARARCAALSPPSFLAAVLSAPSAHGLGPPVRCRALPCAAVRCRALPCVAVRCRDWQATASSTSPSSSHSTSRPASTPKSRRQ